jgi:outer membrane protein TolC
VYSSALRSLRVLIGAQGGSTLELTEEFPSEYASLDLPVLAARLRDNEPTLNALRQNAAAMDDAVSIRKAEYYPTVSGFATWDHLGTGNSYDVGEENRDDYGVAGIKVSVPLWTSGQTSAQLQQARIDARNARLELKKTDKNLGLALDDALAEYDEYNETLAARNEAVKLAEESFSMYRDMFASGQISLSDLNDAELFLTSEKLKRETTLFNINVTLAKIEKLTGAGL